MQVFMIASDASVVALSHRVMEVLGGLLNGPII